MIFHFLASINVRYLASGVPKSNKHFIFIKKSVLKSIQMQVWLLYLRHYASGSGLLQAVYVV